MLRVLRRWGPLLVATIALAVPATADAAPNDIEFMGTKTEGGRKCETFKPPFTGSYCPAGAATFRAKGDKLFACDYKVDSRSVVVRGRYGNSRGWTTVAVNYWGPNRFNGCRTADREFEEDRSVEFKVCLAKDAKPGAPRMNILGGTCGPVSETFNASR